MIEYSTFQPSEVRNGMCLQGFLTEERFQISLPNDDGWCNACQVLSMGDGSALTSIQTNLKVVVGAACYTLPRRLISRARKLYIVGSRYILKPSYGTPLSPSMS